ncbi:hypothetical protein [Aureimonas sp. AU40]|uniref:hypothetical protein n=1 Tax=Aureimonas sp. AU40 TaxID=1637747 RepID=UPI000782C332|nr:hypothetical protein [Aureimonas sp. AU40]
MADQQTNPLDLKWKWWHGDRSNEEASAIGPYSTRESAIANAKGYGHQKPYVFEATTTLILSDFIDAETLLNDIEERRLNDGELAEDDDGPWFEATKEQAEDLKKRLKAAADEWQLAHDLHFRGYTFIDYRNESDVPADDA